MPEADVPTGALDTDDRVASAKGPERPFNTLKDRITMMRALRGVDEVRCFSTTRN